MPRLALVILMVVLLVLSACGGGEAELGSEDNPIIWVFVPSGETERVTAGAEELAGLLEDETGLFFDISVATEYAGAIEALCSDPPEAHMASLATFAYILAADRGCAEAALLALRLGSPTYNGQILANVNSGINDLAGLEGATFCRPDPLSTSGWVVPSIMLRGAGVDPDTGLERIVDAGSHDAVAAAVYNGDCDAGATYIDARTRVEEDFPDIYEVTKVIAVEPDIPNDGVQFVPDLEDDLVQSIVDGLLAVSATEEGTAALDVAYQWEGMVAADDSYYDPFRQIVQAAGIDLADLVQE